MTDQEFLKEIYEGMHKLQNVVERVESEVASMKNDVVSLKSDVISLKSDVIRVENKVIRVENEVISSKKDINSIQLTLENVTNKNINIIAEAHSDLSRKLDEAVKIDSEKELLLIRVNILENEVRKLKETVGNIA